MPTSQFTGTYRSAYVSMRTGVSRRRLQWYDENDMVVPSQTNRIREYTGQQFIEVGLIEELRLKGLSLQKIRKVVSAFRRQFAKGTVSEAAFLVTDGGRAIQLVRSSQRLVDYAKATRGAVYIVSLEELRTKCQ